MKIKLCLIGLIATLCLPLVACSNTNNAFNTKKFKNNVGDYIYYEENVVNSIKEIEYISTKSSKSFYQIKEDGNYNLYAESNSKLLCTSTTVIDSTNVSTTQNDYCVVLKNDGKFAIYDFLGNLVLDNITSNPTINTDTYNGKTVDNYHYVLSYYEQIIFKDASDNDVEKYFKCVLDNNYKEKTKSLERTEVTKKAAAAGIISLEAGEKITQYDDLSKYGNDDYSYIIDDADEYFRLFYKDTCVFQMSCLDELIMVPYKDYAIIQRCKVVEDENDYTNIKPIKINGDLVILETYSLEYKTCKLTEIADFNYIIKDWDEAFMGEDAFTTVAYCSEILKDATVNEQKCCIISKDGKIDFNEKYEEYTYLSKLDSKHYISSQYIYNSKLERVVKLSDFMLSKDSKVAITKCGELYAFVDYDGNIISNGYSFINPLADSYYFVGDYLNQQYIIQIKDEEIVSTLKLDKKYTYDYFEANSTMDLAVGNYIYFDQIVEVKENADDESFDVTIKNFKQEELMSVTKMKTYRIITNNSYNPNYIYCFSDGTNSKFYYVE